MSYNTVKELFVAICDSIRARKGTTELINHQDIPSEIASIENYYDTFWDSFQDNGNRTDYQYGFTGKGWNDDTFKPKHKITILGVCSALFYKSNIVDLAECFRTCGFDKLDLTNSTTSDYICRESAIKRLPKVIIGENTTLNGFLAYSENLEVIEELRFPQVYNANTALNIRYCYALRRCNVTGFIMITCNFTESSLLETDDAINTIKHLKDFSGTSNSYKYKITFHANVWARLDALGNDSPNGNTWKEYCSDLGWLTA